MSFAIGLDSALQSFMRMQMLQEQMANAKEDRAWQKMMRDRQMEQWGMDTAINNEMKAVPFELASAKNNVGGQALNFDFVKKTLPKMEPRAAEELTGALKGIKDPKQLAEAVKAYQPQFGIQPPEIKDVQPQGVKPPQLEVPSLRAYKGDDGQMYMTADPEKYKPTQSEIMVEQARRLTSGKFGQQGLDKGMQLMNQAREVMKMEQDIAFQDAWNADSFEGKVNGLLGILNGHPMVAGKVEIQPSADGKVTLVHTVPGREKPHVTVLKGDSPEEILQDLGLKIRARTNPDLLLRIQDREMEKAYREQQRADRKEEREAERAHENRMYNLQERKFDHDVTMDQKRYGLQAAEAAESRRARAAAGKEMTPEQKIMQEAQYILRAGMAKSPEEAMQMAYKSAVMGSKAFDAGKEDPAKVPKHVEKARSDFVAWRMNEGADATEAEVARRARIAQLDPAEYGARSAPDPKAVAAAVAAAKKQAPAQRQQALPSRPQLPARQAPTVNVANDPVIQSLRATARELQPVANTPKGAQQLQAVGTAINQRMQQIRAKTDPHIKLIDQ